MADMAKLILDGKEYQLPVVRGSEGEVGLDISKLRAQSGAITLDPGFGNTGACNSAITFLDGEQGILRYRGYKIEDLCKNSTFLEVAHLLINGALPTGEQNKEWHHHITHHSMIKEDIKRYWDAWPQTAHPMALLSSVVSALSTFYEDSFDVFDPRQVEISIHRLLAKIPTVAAYAYKKSVGQPYIYPKNSLGYTENFLRMMFAMPTEDYEVNPILAQALDQILILHADHEQNCSTSTVRMVGSSHANLFASVAAGVCALWGPLHGGANQEVLEMLELIQKDGGNVDKYVAKAKDKDDHFRLYGFGHRVYKNFDPRATILKETAKGVLKTLGVQDPLLEVAQKLEEIALKDPYFIEKKLYPNVDFYSGIIYKAMGFPTKMFPVLFAMGRLPGWIAQWKEMIESPETKIGRPRQIYTGANVREYVPLSKR
ncbi:MAG: citrate (Si)-synthase [Candidatus Lambdaproteobacteria bacterium RIFOXYD1_FULL_56_27]|uniref:Citrate synthase n=1 Tax=Candidatus Lambdaproteobacteria bacterium RIFOXYD2_FULL_56_26 TaxID=1817773 RepID=A0A1F6H442_9PROT|nr:MAG: citrate (Si)-synthase [Candidatus Lambdaproteobacteria bacterium RIFOXYD2_FULL_56_26]OGH09391.1 MAG: citrate (Si)-synthase [Candidatus Lambdaproteobacteria bacterium RIFOXYD1_FULL_56_27]